MLQKGWHRIYCVDVQINLFDQKIIHDTSPASKIENANSRSAQARDRSHIIGGMFGMKSRRSWILARPAPLPEGENIGAINCPGHASNQWCTSGFIQATARS